MEYKEQYKELLLEQQIKRGTKKQSSRSIFSVPSRPKRKLCNSYPLAKLTNQHRWNGIFYEQSSLLTRMLVRIVTFNQQTRHITTKLAREEGPKVVMLFKPAKRNELKVKLTQDTPL